MMTHTYKKNEVKLASFFYKMLIVNKFYNFASLCLSPFAEIARDKMQIKPSIRYLIKSNTITSIIVRSYFCVISLNKKLMITATFKNRAKKLLTSKNE